MADKKDEKFDQRYDLGIAYEDYKYDENEKWQQKDSSSIDWSQYILLTENADSPAGYLVPRAAKGRSPMLQGMLADEEPSPDTPAVIACNNFERPIVYLVAKYLAYYGENPTIEPRTIPRPFTDAKLPVSKFDEGFVNVNFPSDAKDISNIIGVMNVANFLQVGSLLDLCCAHLTLRMRGKTPDGIRAIFDGQRLPRQNVE